MNRDTVISVEAQHYLPVFGRCQVVLSHGKGAKVYDVNGKEYLDFFAGIAVNILGHAHPALVAAIKEQAEKMIHCSNLFYTEEQSGLVQKLAALSGLERVFLTNSGAESMEAAIKIARKYGNVNGGKNKILSASNSFHGRTLATLTATAQPKYQQGFEPLPAGFDYVKFNDAQDLKNKFDGTVCAVILEPVQGEGGVNPATQEFLQTAKTLCGQNNALLIFDEIQTGICRTGRMFCFEHYGIKPDVCALAKGLGGGYPIGAVLCSERAASALAKGDHGSTFGGNPLGCAAANAVLEVCQKENLAHNAAHQGEYLFDRLEELKKDFPIIKEVRGKGLLIGMQLTKPGTDIVNKCLERGLMINCTAGNVLRFAPPLTITKEDIDRMITILKEVFYDER